MKKTERMSGLLYLLEAAGQFLTAYCLYQTLYSAVYHQDMFSASRGLWMFPVILLYTFFRSRCSNFFLFFAGHAVIAGACIFLLPGFLPEIGFLVILAVLVLTAVSVLERYCLRIERSGWLMLSYGVVLIAAAAFSYTKGFSPTWKAIYGCGFAQILLLFFFQNRCELISFLEMNREIADFPQRQIKSVNRLMIGIYLVIGLAVMGIFTVLPFGTVFSAVGNGLLGMIRYFVRLIFQNGGGEEEAAGGGPAAVPPAAATAWEPSAFLKFLGILAAALFITALCVGLVVGLIYLCVHIYRAFYDSRRLDADEKEFLKPFGRAEKVGRRKRREAGADFSGSAGGKIRRLYQKIIQEEVQEKTEIPLSSTAKEQMRLADFQRPEEERELLELYRKARYSRESCGSREVSRARALKKLLRQKKS